LEIVLVCSVSYFPGALLEHEGFEVLKPVVMKSSIFWDITPFNPFKVNRRFGGIRRLHRQGRRWQAEPLAFTPVYCFAYSSTLRMEATYSFETSLDFQRITHKHIFIELRFVVLTAVTVKGTIF
jgi:hypothetical protein